VPEYLPNRNLVADRERRWRPRAGLRTLPCRGEDFTFLGLLLGRIGDDIPPFAVSFSSTRRTPDDRAEDVPS